MAYTEGMTTYERRPGIYVVVNTVTGGRYFGSAQHLGRRRQRHFYDLRRCQHLNLHLQAAWNRDGEQAFEFRVLAILEKDDLRAAEQKLIDLFYGCEDCYNVSRDASAPMAGRKHSADAIDRMRAKITGLKRSDEAKARYSAASKQRGFSDLARERSRKAVTGKKQTPEHREKIAAWRRGRKQKPETVAKRMATRAANGKKESPEVIEAKRQRVRDWWAANPEAREQMAERRRTSKVSDKARANMAAAQTGRKQSEETKAKCRAAKLAYYAAKRESA